ncbi:DUF2252 family protein [Alteromonas sp. 1_MG-2023]|uniref:DUF2252 family protein n=1 Tax=Alteromonas sp. 1_MG-2023 TaxID=3062669 RepID=UPI0026E43D99|nr:DUF2252 family protein [Alteromonas sp. 1_MG-2023]MDO6566127.1 DUF2252 family protein [Alteromonas sp. 1_MG-2023]
MDRAVFLNQEIAKIDGISPSSHLAKHLKMAQSPFVFYRGSAQLFYADLATHHLMVPKACFSMPLTSVMGDCHTSNFGFLTEEGSHGDTVVFSPNDFDDACVGYAHWDILRFLTSLSLVQAHCEGVTAGHIAIDEADLSKRAIDASHVNHAQQVFLDEYVATCQRVTENANVINEAVDYPPEGKLKKYYRKALARSSCGEKFETRSALAKAVHMKEDGLEFKHITDKYTPLSPSEHQQVLNAFAPYMDDDIVDITSRENAGTGSVNLRRFYFLVGPKKPHTAESFRYCHIVEVKQQRKAAPLFYFENVCPVNKLNPAHLTARSQRRMQRRPDLLLDEVIWDDAHWLIRSRHHAKVGLDPQDIGLGNKAREGDFSYFAKLCGYTLALAHCRGDRRSTRFARGAVNTLTKDTINALINSANQYSKQVIEDHAWFCETLKNG